MLLIELHNVPEREGKRNDNACEHAKEVIRGRLAPLTMTPEGHPIARNVHRLATVSVVSSCAPRRSRRRGEHPIDCMMKIEATGLGLGARGAVRERVRYELESLGHAVAIALDCEVMVTLRSFDADGVSTYDCIGELPTPVADGDD